MNQQTEERRLP